MMKLSSIYTYLVYFITLWYQVFCYYKTEIINKTNRAAELKVIFSQIGQLN